VPTRPEVGEGVLTDGIAMEIQLGALAIHRDEAVAALDMECLDLTLCQGTHPL